MPVPYLAGALKGWTKKTTVKIVTKSVVDHEVSESTSTVTLDINKQPMPAWKVNKKPEDQRTWIWWSFIIQKPSVLLKTDDIVTIDSTNYRIMAGNNWVDSGFQKCEAIEDYT